MSDRSAIEWTDATWNPMTGCTPVSEGCEHCWAKAFHDRWYRAHLDDKTVPPQYRRPFSEVQLHPERLDQPLHWRQPRRVFVCATSDLFHEDVPGEFIERVFVSMFVAKPSSHDFQLLTKRPGRMAEFMRRASETTLAAVYGMAHLWAGTTIESAAHIDRADILRDTPAAVRWISAEPLLGPLVWPCETCDGKGSLPWADCPDCHGRGCSGLDLTGIDWLVIGAESGPHRRPMDVRWLRDLVDAADAAGTRVFVKQGSHRLPGKQGDIPDELWRRKEFPG